jgi:hypothetical protein
VPAVPAAPNAKTGNWCQLECGHVVPVLGAPPATSAAARRARGGGKRKEKAVPIKIATPKLPYLVADSHYGYRPTIMEHVRELGWIEVQVGEEPVYTDGKPRNIVFCYAVGFSETGTIFAVVRDQTQLPELTGLRFNDVIEVELHHILKSEFSPAQQDLELWGEMEELGREIVSAHRDEFDRAYPQYSQASFEQAWTAGGRELQEWGRGGAAAQREFVAKLVAEGRA